MHRLATLRTQERTIVLMACVCLYAGVFAASLASDDPTTGVTFLYLVPTVVIAIYFGLAGAMLGVAVSFGLLGLWHSITPHALGHAGYGVRALVFICVAVICAQLAKRLHVAASENKRYFELASDMLCVGTLDGEICALNGRWEEVLGWSQQELMEHGFEPFIHPGDRERTQAGIAAFVENGVIEETFTNRMLTTDGGWRHVEWSARVDPGEGRLYCAARDVTDRVTTAQARYEAEERFRVAFEDSSAGMALVGLHGADTGRILTSNDELATILGVDREELIGTFSLSSFAHPEDLPTLQVGVKSLAEGEINVLHDEVRIVRPGGEARWVDLTTSIVRAEDGTPRYRLSQLYDIEVRKQTEQQLRHLADHDPLSCLFNHRRFMADLTGELAGQATSGSRGAVMLIDLDHFKAVNDTAGHAVGDEVIKAVGLALVGRLRSGDVAGRLGGDEFAVLLRRVEAEQAVLVAHDLLAAVRQTLSELPVEQARAVTLSIGVAMIDGETPTLACDLMAEADSAMYAAKRRGGARVELATRSVPGVPASAVPPAPLLAAGPHLL